jgi:hypothetical protein
MPASTRFINLYPVGRFEMPIGPWRAGPGAGKTVVEVPQKAVGSSVKKYSKTKAGKLPNFPFLPDRNQA